MNEETLTALKGSIKKWEGIRDGKELDKGCGNCPLCQIFFDGACAGCPVAVSVGDIHCRCTPYGAFDNASDAYDYITIHNINGLYPITERSKQLAQAEVDFLKSLLPEGEENHVPQS